MRSLLRPAPPFDQRSVTLAELGVLATATSVAVVALVSLVTAHLGVHSVLSVAIGTVVLLAPLAVVAVRGRPPITRDALGLVPTAVAVLLGAWLFLPGFHYVAGDKDPGGYVAHAFAIARTGSYAFTDRLLAAGDLSVQLAGPGARFPGIWVADEATGEIVPQFYHLWPALMATSYDARGYGALANTGPLLGIVAVALAVLVARRIGGPVAAWGTALLLPTNMMQVWQAKYPTAEILGQELFLLALLGVVLAVHTGWRPPALVAGGAVGACYLDRADGLLLVLFAVVVLAALAAVGRFDGRAVCFAAGLGALLPYGLWQAYGPAGEYTRSNQVPGRLPVIGAIVLLAVAGGLVGRWSALRSRVDARVADPATRHRIGLGAVGVVGLLFVLGVVRPAFGVDRLVYAGTPIRSYDERNLWRLAWFFTWPGLVLLVVGVAWLVLRRWSAPGWLVVVPTIGLLTLYCFHARNSPYFMWVGRRFVPSVLPGMVLLIAFGLAAVWLARVRNRRVGVPVAVALLLGLCLVQTGQSRPLDRHDEWGGAYGTVQAIGALSGEQRGVYLWARADYCCGSPEQLFAAAVWLIEDDDSAYLPTDPARIGGYVRRYLNEFGDRPVFLVYESTVHPPTLPGVTVTPVARYADTLPHWEESASERPDEARRIPYDVTVYRARPAPLPA